MGYRHIENLYKDQKAIGKRAAALYRKLVTTI